MHSIVHGCVVVFTGPVCVCSHWCVFVLTGVCLFSLVFVCSHWCVFVLTGVCLFSLVCVCSHWCVFVLTGVCLFSLVCVCSHWCVFVLTGVCMAALTGEWLHGWSHWYVVAWLVSLVCDWSWEQLQTLLSVECVFSHYLRIKEFLISKDYTSIYIRINVTFTVCAYIHT